MRNKILYIVAGLLLFGAVAVINVTSLMQAKPSTESSASLEFLKADAFFPENPVPNSGRALICCGFYCCVTWNTALSDCDADMLESVPMDDATGLRFDPWLSSLDDSEEVQIYDCDNLEDWYLDHEDVLSAYPNLIDNHWEFHLYLFDTY